MIGFDLISQPKVIFGRIMGSALIRSSVCIMASTLWIPYCSRTAPHFLSWTWLKDGSGLPTLTTEAGDVRKHAKATLSAGGWWWTENRAPMMMSPGMWANTLLSLFWALTPARSLRPSQLGSAPRITPMTKSLANTFPISMPLLTPPAILRLP